MDRVLAKLIKKMANTIKNEKKKDKAINAETIMNLMPVN